MKTSELTGSALDWAVAKAQNMSWWHPQLAKWDTNDGYTDWILNRDKDGVLKRYIFDGSASRSGRWCVAEEFQPSTNWSQGGPIIERERIGIWDSADEAHQGEWAAATRDWMSMNVESDEFLNSPMPYHGPTPLIAAMRCFVASKLGEEIEMPLDLV